MSLVSKIGLGSVQFGIPYGVSNIKGKTSPREVKRILAFASASNITTIDSASAYGNAEAVLGENNLEHFEIVSKYIHPPAGELVEIQLFKTLSQLNVPALYGYLAHRPMEIITNPSQWQELCDFRAKGLVKKIGFSLNKPAELTQLLDKNFIPDIVQVPFNYLDNRFESLLQHLKKIGCEIHCRSAFLQGLFFKNPASLPSFFDEVKPHLTYLQSFQQTSPGLLLRYVAEKSFVDKVIVGVENEEQLKQNIAVLQQATSLSLGKPESAITEEILMPSCWPDVKAV